MQVNTQHFASGHATFWFVVSNSCTNLDRLVIVLISELLSLIKSIHNMYIVISHIIIHSS